MDKIIKNTVRCLKCGDIIESKYTHDFKWYKCHNIAVDGGRSYLKRSFQEYDTWEDLSEVISINDGDE